jgi:hypothetical protein
VHAAGGNGANFVSPDAKVVEHVGAVGFVDDTTEAINDFTNDSATPSLMVDKATRMLNDGMIYWRLQVGRWKSRNASSIWLHTNSQPPAHQFWTH